MRRPLLILVAASYLVLSDSSHAQTISLVAPRVGGYIQLREVAQEHVGLTASLNRARLSADGSLPAHFAYRMLVEYEASAGRNLPAVVSLREAIIRWAPGSLALTAGQFKTPFSREYLLPVPALETPDFAGVVDSLSPKYDVGVMAEYSTNPIGQVYLGVFNGEGQNSIANRDSSVMWVARVVARPVAPVALGASATRDGPDSLRWGVEANLEYYGVMVRSEYITRHRRGRAQSLDDHGWYVLGVVRTTPRLQILTRVEDFQRPAIGLSRRQRGLTLGTITEISPNRVRLLVDFVRRKTGAAQIKTDQFIGQIQVRF